MEHIIRPDILDPPITLLNNHWKYEYSPYIPVHKRSERYDIIVSDVFGEKDQKYFVLQNPNYNKEWNLIDAYKKLIYYIKYGLNCGNNFTINENPTTCSKLYLDLDFNKGDFDELKKKEWIDEILSFVKKYTNAKHILHFNKYNGNYHIVWDTYDTIQNIKGMHILLQDHFIKTYNNVKKIIDKSDGIRSILTLKQKKYENGYSFQEGDFYIPENENLTMNLNYDELAEYITKYSIYNLKGIPKMEYHIDIWAASKRGTLQKLSSNDLEKIYEYEHEKNNITSEDFNEYIKKRGYIKDELIQLIPDDFGMCVPEESYLGKEIKVYGTTIRITIEMYKGLLNILPNDFLSTRQSWFWLAYLTKALEDEDGKIFALFQKKSELVPNYEERWTKNNKTLFNTLQKINPNFYSLIETCRKLKMKDTLKLLHIDQFHYFKWKENKGIYQLNNAKITRYNNEFTREFNNQDGLEIIQANMGLGKTTRLEEYIKKLPEETTILIITPKRSLGYNFTKRFPSFEHYSNINGPINQPKVICQLESICRIKKIYDVVIMDEVHELLTQFLSPFHDPRETKLKFFPIITSAKIVKMLDAHISPLVMEFVNLYFNDYQYTKNTYKKVSNTYTYYKYEGKLTYQFEQALKDKKKIIFCSNNVNVIERMQKLATDYYTNENDVLVVYKKSSEKCKKEVVVNSDLISKSKVFIYSPTITVGVDIQDPFDVVFGVFNNHSNDANSCIQMLNRVRNITDNQIHLYIQHNNKAENYHTFDYITKRRSLGNIKYEQLNNFEITTVVENKDIVERVKDDKFNHFLLSILNNKVKSHNEFLGLMIHYSKMTGGDIKYNDEKNEPYTYINDELKTENHEVFKKTTIDESFKWNPDIPDIPENKYKMNKVKHNHLKEDKLIVTPEDQAMKDKYELTQIYGDQMDVNTITIKKYKDHVKNYLALSSQFTSDHRLINNLKQITKKNNYYLQWCAGYIVLQELLKMEHQQFNHDRRTYSVILNDTDMIKLKWSKENVFKAMQCFKDQHEKMNLYFDKRAKTTWDSKSIHYWINRMLSLFKLKIISITSSKYGPNNNENRETYILDYDNDIKGIINLHIPTCTLSFNKFIELIDEDKTKEELAKDNMFTILDNHIITNPDIYKNGDLDDIRYGELHELVLKHHPKYAQILENDYKFQRYMIQ